MRHDFIASGILVLGVHESVYLGCSLIFLVVDVIPYFNQFKIQKVSSPIEF